MSKQFKSITVKGDLKEIGFQVGQQDAEAIHQVVFQMAEFQQMKANWYGSEYLNQLDQAARRHYPEYVEELEHMALGAEADYSSLLIWNCRGDLPSIENNQESSGTPEGCTTLLIPANGDRPATIAHNEDGDEELDGYCSWLTAEPTTGLKFSSFHYPGFLSGNAVAVNEKGLVQTINDIRPNDLKPGIPRHFICRAILDCGQISEALEILKRKDRAAGFHHALGTVENGEITSVEAPASACHVQKINQPVSHANHLLGEPFCDLSQTITNSSAFRQKKSVEMIADLKPLDAKSILFQQSETGLSIYRRPDNLGDDYAFTLATALFELAESSVTAEIYLNRQVQPAIRQKTTLPATS